jgi:hypothetical protein
MSELYGALGIADSDRAFTQVSGQQVIWDMTEEIFNRWNEDAMVAASMFIDGDTPNFKERYYLPGGGSAQDEDEQMAGETAAVNTVGQWDVAYPIYQSGDSIAYDDIAIRFITLARFEAAVKSVMMRSNTWMFTKILKAIFKNTNTTFNDKINGALTLVPLANQDGVLYPPPLGTTSAEAQQNLYLATSYAETAISDTNNPFVTIRDTLEPIYGIPQGGSPIVAFVNKSTLPYVVNLSGFIEFTNRYVNPAVTLSTLESLPNIPPGSRIVGVDTLASVVIVEWPRMPAGYIIALHANAPKPLKRRVDPPDTGLRPGLTMWSQTVGQPFQTGRWRNRMGFAVGNRLGAAVVYLNGSGTYAIPSAYS